jgi:hypothetical protein
MADESGMDIRAHQQMWLSFMNIVKWACIFIAIVLILMATFLVH